MEPDSHSTTPAEVSPRSGDPTTEQLPIERHDQVAAQAGHRRRRTPWIIAAGLVLAVVAVVVPLSSKGGGSPGVGENTSVTGSYTVVRQDLSSDTEVSATLGYADTYSLLAPSGASAQEVIQDQETVTQDQQTLSGDEQTESDTATADSQAIAAAQGSLNADQSTLSSDEATQSTDCAGSGSSSPACTQDQQKVSSDQTQLTQADQQLASAQSAATLDHDQNQAKVQSDETKLQGDQATLALDQAMAANPGTTYTWLPEVGDVIKEDQTLYSLNNEPVPLLYGSVTAYRAFYVGMSDGADVGELTADLIALGYGSGLTQSNHYSSATAAAVDRWQSALGLPATGEVLLGEVLFEPGPIRVTSVTPTVGESVGGGGGSASGAGGAGSGGASGGGGSVLAATSTTRQVSVSLDADEESEVAVGDKVTITLPNNETTPGVISSVGTVASSSGSGSGSSSGDGSGSGSSSSDSSGSGSSSSTITVLVNPTDPAATGDWDQAQVNVTITTGTVSNALGRACRRAGRADRRGLRSGSGAKRRRPPSGRSHLGSLRRRGRFGPSHWDQLESWSKGRGAEAMNVDTTRSAVASLG